MGFASPGLNEAVIAIRRCAAEASSPYNDGWTASDCKKKLVELKWLLEDLIEMCPTFSGEEEWEQERLVQLLKK